MRALLAAFVIASAAACGGRQVEVRTGAQPAAAAVSVRMTNNLSQAVNVYVTSGGSDLFLRQVPANSTEELPVQGVAAGSSVSLKARTVDGTRTYSKDNVVLSSSNSWQVP
jgi:hypothetical protein